jgi:hypothetical protein
MLLAPLKGLEGKREVVGPAAAIARAGKAAAATSSDPPAITSRLEREMPAASIDRGIAFLAVGSGLEKPPNVARTAAGCSRAAQTLAYASMRLGEILPEHPRRRYTRMATQTVPQKSEGQ